MLKLLLVLKLCINIQSFLAEGFMGNFCKIIILLHKTNIEYFAKVVGFLHAFSGVCNAYISLEQSKVAKKLSSIPLCSLIPSLFKLGERLATVANILGQNDISFWKAYFKTRMSHVSKINLTSTSSSRLISVNPLILSHVKSWVRSLLYIVYVT